MNSSSPASSYYDNCTSSSAKLSFFLNDDDYDDDAIMDWSYLDVYRRNSLWHETSVLFIFLLCFFFHISTLNPHTYHYCWSVSVYIFIVDSRLLLVMSLFYVLFCLSPRFNFLSSHTRFCYGIMGLFLCCFNINCMNTSLLN